MTSAATDYIEHVRANAVGVTSVAVEADIPRLQQMALEVAALSRRISEDCRFLMFTNSRPTGEHLLKLFGDIIGDELEPHAARVVLEAMGVTK